MERYYFKTKFQPPDVECVEPCNVKKDGTMIGSYNCIICQFHVENDMNGGDEMSWLKCSKLSEALGKNEALEEDKEPTEIKGELIQSEKTRKPNSLNYKMRALFDNGKLTQWEYSQYKAFVRSFAKSEGLYYDETDEQFFEIFQP